MKPFFWERPIGVYMILKKGLIVIQEISHINGRVLTAATEMSIICRTLSISSQDLRNVLSLTSLEKETFWVL